jgi:hypothetical protein
MSKLVHGTVVGSTIHLTSDPGLDDGQEVEVLVRPVCRRSTEPGAGLRAAFGGWSDNPEGLNDYVRDVYEARKSDYRKLPE